MSRVDPEVCRLKFASEIARLADQHQVLQSRGIFVLGTPTYPVVDVLFVPRHPLRIAVGQPQPSSAQATLTVAELPSLSARSFKGRFDLSDYDLRAPSLEFLDPWTSQPLSFATMFRALEYEQERKAHVVLLDPHPTTQKPFLCIRGIREYHEHPQHSGDEWLLYRNDMSLFSILNSVWRVTVDLVHPVLIPQYRNVQVQWNVEEKL